MENAINIFDLQDEHLKNSLIQKASWAAINEFNRVRIECAKAGRSDEDAMEFAQAALEYEAEVQKFMLTGVCRSDAQGLVDSGATVQNIALMI